MLSLSAIGRIFVPLILRKEVVEIADASNAHMFMFGRHTSNHWKGTKKVVVQLAAKTNVWQRKKSFFQLDKLLEYFGVYQSLSDHFDLQQKCYCLSTKVGEKVATFSFSA